MEQTSLSYGKCESASGTSTQCVRRSGAALGSGGCLDGRGMGFRIVEWEPKNTPPDGEAMGDEMFQQEVFDAYWKSPREAEVAESLRVLMIEILGRPSSLMLKPTDRFGVWPDCDHDSLDRVEFIVDLQFKYDIDISDEDGVRWFTRYTFYEAVQDIVMRLENHVESA